MTETAAANVSPSSFTFALYEYNFNQETGARTDRQFLRAYKGIVGYSVGGDLFRLQTKDGEMLFVNVGSADEYILVPETEEAGDE